MAFYTLLERKILGYIQLRKGPNKVSLMGIPQPLSDAMKLFLKEPTIPTYSNSSALLSAPLLNLLLILLLWSLYPHYSPSLYFTLGILLFLCISSLNVYTTLAAGWASNSKYALLGSIRSVAQTISYEVSMALILLGTLCLIQSLSMNYLTTSPKTMILMSTFPLLMMWLITCLAETNRAPFDFVEGESELVSGFNVEYGSGGFAMLFMSEYASILFLSMVTTILYFNYNLLPLLMNILIPLTASALSLIYIWVRGSLPRLRYDRLMNLTWKSLLPLSIMILMLNLSVLQNILWYHAGHERVALMWLMTD
uniref:NADH-ubiquinone oxidoreductase chain 1 n=1 Tax=Lumbriclymenella robusta TaxID=3138170 RepID=A0AB38ZFX8_9ANNE